MDKALSLPLSEFLGVLVEEEHQPLRAAGTGINNNWIRSDRLQEPQARRNIWQQKLRAKKSLPSAPALPSLILRHHLSAPGSSSHAALLSPASPLPEELKEAHFPHEEQFSSPEPSASSCTALPVIYPSPLKPKPSPAQEGQSINLLIKESSDELGVMVVPAACHSSCPLHPSATEH